MKTILIVGGSSCIASAKINGHLAKIKERGLEIINIEDECSDMSQILPKEINLEFTRMNFTQTPFIPDKKIRSKYKRKLKYR